MTAGPGTRRALVLGGGGIVGAMYQVGCLAALEEADPALVDFDLYVGTSGGSVVAALLAAGYCPAELLELAPSFAPRNLCRTDWKSMIAFASRVPFRIASAAWGRRGSGSPLWHRAIAAVQEAAPPGMFSLDPLARFLRDLILWRDGADRFDAPPHALRVPAIDLDWGERVVFGEGSESRAPVSDAVAASCAIPSVFRPVRIGDRDLVDGAVGDPLNLDVALRGRVREVVAVSAMVAPLNDRSTRCLPSVHAGCGRIAEQGLATALGQATKIGHMLRSEASTRLLAASHRGATIHVVQPNRLEISLDGPMDFGAAAGLLAVGARDGRRFAEWCLQKRAASHP